MPQTQSSVSQLSLLDCFSLFFLCFLCGSPCFLPAALPSRCLGHSKKPVKNVQNVIEWRGSHSSSTRGKELSIVIVFVLPCRDHSSNQPDDSLVFPKLNEINVYAHIRMYIRCMDHSGRAFSSTAIIHVRTVQVPRPLVCCGEGEEEAASVFASELRSQFRDCSMNQNFVYILTLISIDREEVTIPTLSRKQRPQELGSKLLYCWERKMNEKIARNVGKTRLSWDEMPHRN